ncbi:MAG: molybdenum cofactor guanylyltransferase [Deltaproteobacteria bacterium]|nr:molybdenum cofactor guanylyltransferase [Deltaproteobacteria bacterium]
MTGFAGVVLAGGGSRRMGGRSKAFIEIGGKPIIEKTLALFRGLFGEVVVVTNTPAPYRRFEGVKLVSDVIPGCGPAGGIHAALDAIGAPMGFVAACDMPMLDERLIRRVCGLARGAGVECVVPRSAAGIEPLHAVYAKSLAPRFETMLRAGTRKVLDVIDASRCAWFELSGSDLRAISNFNTPEDLAALLPGNSR